MYVQNIGVPVAHFSTICCSGRHSYAKWVKITILFSNCLKPHVSKIDIGELLWISIENLVTLLNTVTQILNVVKSRMFFFVDKSYSIEIIQHKKAI